MFLRGRYFVMDSPIDMNVDFLKCVALQLFPKYSQRYANLNVKKQRKIQLSLKTRRVVLVFFYLDITYRILIVF